VLSSVLQTGLSGLKTRSVGDEAGTQVLLVDDSTESRLQAALEQTLLKNIQYKVIFLNHFLLFPGFDYSKFNGQTECIAKVIYWN